MYVSHSDSNFFSTLPNRLFEHKLRNPGSMTIKALKETVEKRGIASELPQKPKKNDFVAVLTKYDDDFKDIIHRISISPLNGQLVWYELVKRTHHSSFKKIEFDKYALYDRKSANLFYDTIKNEWTKQYIIFGKVGQPFTFKSSNLNELRDVLLYVEKKNAFINASLFELFLTKDVVTHIRSLL